jgi:O-antigen/teichoic acid export membrane protein
MSVIHRIAKNTTALFIAQIIISVSSIILSVFVARLLGDVMFGKYSFALAFVTFYTIFLDLGYNTLLIREVAREKSLAKKYLENVLGFRLILSLIVFVFIVVTINITAYSSETKNVVYLLGIYLLVASFSDVFKLTFRAFEKMEFEALIALISNIIRVSAGLMVLFLGYGIFELAMVFIVSAIADLLLSLFICEKKFVKSTVAFDIQFFKTTIKIALPLGMLSIFALVYNRIDTIMLEVMKGDAVVGWYNAASNLTYGFKPIPHLFMSALLPIMSYYFVSSKNSLKIAYEKAFKYLFILGLPIAVGTTLLSDKIILFFYGPQFTNSIIALEILSWDILLIFLYACSAFLLVAIDKQKQMAIIAGVTAVINIVLNLVLIPCYSYVGSAVATIVAEGFLFIAYLYLTTRYLHKIPFQRFVLQPLLACLVMGVVLYFFHSYNLLVLILGGGLLYLGLVYVLKGFSSEDIALIKKLVKR